MATENEKEERRIRVVIADDHPMMREGTRLLLERTADIQVVGTAGLGALALELAQTLRPDVLVLDVRLPDVSGIEVARRLRSGLPEIGIVVLTGYDDVGYYHALVKVGVRGYLRKTSSGEEIIAAVRAVAKGAKVLGYEGSRSAAGGEKEALTAREYEVLCMLVDGHRNGEIADELNVSLKTVEFHVSHIMQKLGARSRAEAVAIVLERGLVQPERGGEAL